MDSTTWMTLDQLREWDRNPKRHSDTNTSEIARSIRRFGFVAPVVVWKSQGQIVAGHGRYKAAALILRNDPGALLALDAPGPGLVPVRLVEFASETEAAAYAIADNRLTEVNPMDDAAVAAILREIDEQGGSVEGLGYDVSKLLTDTGIDVEPESTDSVLGEMKYRIVVDCRSESHQAQLLEQFEKEGIQCQPLIS